MSLSKAVRTASGGAVCGECIGSDQAGAASAGDRQQWTGKNRRRSQAAAAQAIAAAGASILYLPAYSPDLNPIEQVFAKLKALLRKAAARTRDELWGVIGSLLDAFTPAECRNYLENAGYAFT